MKGFECLAQAIQTQAIQTQALTNTQTLFNITIISHLSTLMI